MNRPTSTDPKQLDVVFTSERQKTVMAAMDGLSRNHKEILMLRYYSDLSYREIAVSLEIKLGTVMSRLSRAKQQLMHVLEEPEVAQG